mgnify:CR=1 FL=1
MVDPIARAIQTYGALKGLELQSQAAKDRKEDREYQRRMLEKQDLRADEQFALNQKAHQENAEWTRMERGRKVADYREQDIAAARNQADQILLEFTGQMKAQGKQEFGQEDIGLLLERLEPVQHGLKRKLSALYDPGKVTERKEATENILKQLYTGEFDQKSLVENGNIAFADELAERGKKYGAKDVRFSLLAPSPEGDGFMAEFEITRPDGSKYRAPATVGGGTVEDGDNEVKNFRLEEVFPYLAGQLQTLQGAEAYLKARGKIKEPENDWTFGADGSLRMNKKTGEVAKTGYVKPQGSGATGKSEPIMLKTGIPVQLSELRQGYAAYLKPRQTKDLATGVTTYGDAKSFEEWVNEQAAEPVFMQEEREPQGIDIYDPIYATARKQAEDWVKSQAKAWNFDSKDFAEFGGNREQAIAEKTMEFYQRLKGGAGQSPAARGLDVAQQGPKQLDPQNPEHATLARQFLQQAKGDKAKARQLAQQAGYSF